jgi:hypothetical protein
MISLPFASDLVMKQHIMQGTLWRSITAHLMTGSESERLELHRTF